MSGALVALGRVGMLFAVAACADDPIVRSVTDDAFVKNAYENREPAVPNIQVELPHAREYHLPDSVAQFGLEAPRAIDALGTPVCEIIIADGIDDAIHRFGITGEYRGTLHEPRSRRFSAVGSVAIDVGRIWVSYLAAHDIAVIDRTGGSANRFRIPALSDSLVPYSRLSRGPDGTLLEHWIGGGMATWSGNWDGTLPMIRWFSHDGTLLGRAGAIRPTQGQVLTAALNRGFLDYAKDTVWFAEAAAARIIAAPVRRMAGEWHGVTISLPIPYRMRPPTEYRERQTGRAFARVEYHLTAFAVAPSAEMLALGYVLSWPDPESQALFQPRTVLALDDRVQATLLPTTWAAGSGRSGCRPTTRSSYS